MEICNNIAGFTTQCRTGSGETVYLCALCPAEETEKIKESYLSAVNNADFSGIKDDYLIDISLYNIIRAVSSKAVKAMGIGIIIKDADHTGGGIIGNPNDEGRSANDKADNIGDDLWCVAYSGRFGAVFKADSLKAREISEKIDGFNNNDIAAAVSDTKNYLINNTDMFLILSDGSGIGGYPYCASYDGAELNELKL